MASLLFRRVQLSGVPRNPDSANLWSKLANTPLKAGRGTGSFYFTFFGFHRFGESCQEITFNS